MFNRPLDCFADIGLLGVALCSRRRRGEIQAR
jgi:hypothetical protein